MLNLRKFKRKIKQVMDADEIQRALEEIAATIFRRNSTPENLIIIGMATRGIYLAQRLAKILAEKYHCTIPTASLDATFYRDDFNHGSATISPKIDITDVPQSIENKDVILVDDVLFTGRSVRAALDAMVDIGRAKTIKLVVLLDRGHRELPIEPSSTGLVIDTRENEEILVNLLPKDDDDSVWLVEVEEE